MRQTSNLALSHGRWILPFLLICDRMHVSGDVFHRKRGSAMIERSNSRMRAAAGAIDAGLRRYMMSVYNHMAIGLGITGLVAFTVSQSHDMMQVLMFSPMRWVVLLAPIAIPFFLGARLGSIKASTAQLLFWIYAGLMGLSLSFLFVIFTGESMARVFFITASMFGSMSLYGYLTQRDLSGMGSFLMMGLFGLIIASLINMFMHSSAMHFVISCLGVLIFTGLTAYDVQNIKSLYYSGDNAEDQEKKAIFGALQLYLDFVNLFIHLMYLLGDRRR